MQLRSLIIEDELKSTNVLKSLLQEFCPEVNNCGEAITIKNAVPLIEQLHPDVVFLDIELPNENGFKLLDYFPSPSFDIVFTTAYDQYAIRAFRLAAVDYLLKPIGISQLKEAVSKVIKKRSQLRDMETYSILKDNIINKKPVKIALPTKNGFSFVKLDDIMYCQANRSYTFFYLVEGKKIIISKPLKWFEQSLDNLNFFRVNRSYLINLDYIQSYSRANGGEVTLESGVNLIISENKRDDFFQKLASLNAGI